MRALLLVPALVLSGCIFCGPPTYFAGWPTTTAFFDGVTWDTARSEEGLRTIPTGEGNASVSHSDRSVTLTMTFQMNCTRESEAEVDTCIRSFQDAQDERVEDALTAFEGATGWMRTGNATWAQTPRGHGDC